MVCGRKQSTGWAWSHLCGRLEPTSVHWYGKARLRAMNKKWKHNFLPQVFVLELVGTNICLSLWSHHLFWICFWHVVEASFIEFKYWPNPSSWLGESESFFSIKQVGDTGKHGLTLINSLSTLFNHKRACNNWEMSIATNVSRGTLGRQRWKHTGRSKSATLVSAWCTADSKAWSRSICLASTNRS